MSVEPLIPAWVRSSSRLLASDHGRDLFSLVTLTPCEGEQLIDPRQHRALLRCAHHSHAATSREIEETLVSQDVEGADHRVLVDAEDRCKVDGPRHSLSWSRLTVRDGPTDLGSHHVVERDRVVLVHAAHWHGT